MSEFIDSFPSSRDFYHNNGVPRMALGKDYTLLCLLIFFIEVNEDVFLLYTSSVLGYVY